MYASRTSKWSKRAVRESAHVTLENLEARQLLSAYHHHYHSGSHSTPSVGGYRRGNAECGDAGCERDDGE